MPPSSAPLKTQRSTERSELRCLRRNERIQMSLPVQEEFMSFRQKPGYIPQLSIGGPCNIVYYAHVA